MHTHIYEKKDGRIQGSEIKARRGIDEIPSLLSTPPPLPRLDGESIVRGF